MLGDPIILHVEYLYENKHKIILIFDTEFILDSMIRIRLIEGLVQVFGRVDR